MLSYLLQKIYSPQRRPPLTQKILLIDIELGQIKPIYLSDLGSAGKLCAQAKKAYLKANDKVDAASF